MKKFKIKNRQKRKYVKKNNKHHSYVLKSVSINYGLILFLILFSFFIIILTPYFKDLSKIAPSITDFGRNSGYILELIKTQITLIVSNSQLYFHNLIQDIINFIPALIPYLNPLPVFLAFLRLLINVYSILNSLLSINFQITFIAINLLTALADNSFKTVTLIFKLLQQEIFLLIQTAFSDLTFICRGLINIFITIFSFLRAIASQALIALWNLLTNAYLTLLLLMKDIASSLISAGFFIINKFNTLLNQINNTFSLFWIKSTNTIKSPFVEFGKFLSDISPFFSTLYSYFKESAQDLLRSMSDLTKTFVTLVKK